MEALKTCLDPELGISIVDLGLIYGVRVEGDKAKIKMTLTTPGCPLVNMINADVEEKVRKVEGIKEVEVELVWEPRWTPDRISEEGKKALGITESKKSE